jgi:hypothetical protein
VQAYIGDPIGSQPAWLVAQSAAVTRSMRELCWHRVQEHTRRADQATASVFPDAPCGRLLGACTGDLTVDTAIKLASPPWLLKA